MRLCNIVWFFVFIVLATASSSVAATNGEVAKYLQVLDTGDHSEIILVAKNVATFGYTDSLVYEKMAQILKNNYASAGEERLAVDEMSWLCKALSSSGMAKYKPLLADVAKNGYSGKLRGYAQRSLEMFDEYAERNKIMANADNFDSDLTAEENRLINMLTSEKVLLVRDAAKIIFRSVDMSETVYDVAAAELARRYALTQQDRVTRDALAWLCKALGHSGNEKYRSVLSTILTGEKKIIAKNDLADERLMRYARLGLNMLH